MSSSDVVALVAAAIGAFLGASFAFLLEESKRERAEESARYASLIQAQFALSMQLRTMVNIRDQYLNEVRNRADRFMLLVPFHGESSDPLVDLGAVGFVAVDGQVDVLQQVHMAQDAYSTALSSLRTRTEMMSALYEVIVPSGDFNFETGAETVSVDARRARRLKGITDGLYESVDSAIQLEHTAIELLAQTGKRLFPKRHFLVVEEVAPSPHQTSTST